MIDVHYAPIPNGWKISILLEELRLPYTAVPIDIRAGIPIITRHAAANTAPACGVSCPVVPACWWHRLVCRSLGINTHLEKWRLPARYLWAISKA